MPNQQQTNNAECQKFREERAAVSKNLSKYILMTILMYNIINVNNKAQQRQQQATKNEKNKRSTQDSKCQMWMLINLSHMPYCFSC
jgi:hypothetical protein